jgi:N-acetylglucosamine kinase-like BadF-type ATPase
MSSEGKTESLGLGIDAGGTQTRWAVAAPDGTLVGHGHVGGLTALQMGSPAGRARIEGTLAEIAAAALAVGRPARVMAGMTGFAEGAEAEALAAMIGAPFGLEGAAVALSGDMEIAYLDVFAPGEGYLVYAGTGSVAAFIDQDDVCHRVGGHGGILDDAGSGFWIAAQALRHVWRAEDERPGQAGEARLAQELFAKIGGSDWNASRQFVYAGGFEHNRGKMGRLALAVAAAASAGDPDASAILRTAGAELARLAQILTRRFGPRPVGLAGRVFELHPLIEQSLRTALPPETSIELRISDAHFAAARIAARSAARR